MSQPGERPIVQPVDICRFDETGNHTVMAENCPHYEMFDEMGRRLRPDWTVQGG